MAFEVWAPDAKLVEVVIDDERLAMEPSERGWHRLDHEVPAGTDYRFSLDGAEAFPDPRSPWQPQGVHGPSRTLDHSAFTWKDDSWSPPDISDWIIYELHIGTFTDEGTFIAATEKLDHLVDLGVTAVELMPVNAFSGDRGWGYDGVDLYAPHSPYGAPEDLKTFVDACHAKGLAVVLDVVYNHLGPAGNYLGQFAPYFTDAYSTPWGDALNFDDSYSDEVRAFFIDNALMWLRDYHFDALRLDAVHAILDTSATHFLEATARRVAELEAATGKPRYLIAESDLNDPRMVTDLDRGGLGMDAQWSDDFHHALHAYITGEQSGYYEDFGSLEQVAKTVRQAFVYDGVYSEHRARTHGRTPQDIPGNRFLAYIQDHDQIGNRAAGERLTHLVDTDMAKVAAGLLLTSPFIPMLFMGEEWGASSPFQYFTAHEDPELGRAVSEGRRNEFASFGWQPEDVPDPQDPETFNRSKLDWSELGAPSHAELLDWHKALIRLRKETPDLRSGDLTKVSTALDDEEGWLMVRRGNVTIGCNFSDSERTIPVGSEQQVVISSSGAPSLEGKSANLPPRSLTLFKSTSS